MSFYERYELLEILNDGPIKTFSARQLQTGQHVAVHLLIGPNTQHEILINKVRNLVEPARKEVLEVGENQGTAYIVTTEWKRMVTFPEWLNAVAAPAAPSPTESPTQSDRFAKAGNWRIPVSEFGRKMEPSIGTPAPPEPQPPEPADPHPPMPEPPAPVAGEFTQMFEAAQRSGTKPASPAKTEEIGEFTRMFEAQNPASASTRPPVVPRTPVRSETQLPPKQSEMGEFTKMFEAPKSPNSAVMFDAPTAGYPISQPTPPPIPPQSTTPQPQQTSDPGEFTRMFQTPAASPDPVVKSMEPSEFDRIFQTPAAKEPVGSFTRTFEVPVMKQPPAAAPPPSPPSTPQAQPGEFTRMFQVPAEPTPAAAPHPPSPQAKQGPGEFTRMFQAPVEHRPSTPNPTPQRPPSDDRPFITPDRTPRSPEPPKAGPGEFTRMFQTPAAPPPPPPTTAKPAAEGEFTKFFQTPQQPATPTAHPAYKDPFAKAAEPSAASRDAGEFTRMFGTPVVSANPMPHAQPPPMMQPPAPPPQPQAQSAGEFTRMFATPSQPMQTPKPAGQAPPAPATPAPAPAARSGKKQNYLPLFIGLGLLLCIAIAIILIFALRK